MACDVAFRGVPPVLAIEALDEASLAIVMSGRRQPVHRHLSTAGGEVRVRVKKKLRFSRTSGLRMPR